MSSSALPTARGSLVGDTSQAHNQQPPSDLDEGPYDSLMQVALSPPVVLLCTVLCPLVLYLCHLLSRKMGCIGSCDGAEAGRSRRRERNANHPTPQNAVSSRRSTDRPTATASASRAAVDPLPPSLPLPAVAARQSPRTEKQKAREMLTYVKLEVFTYGGCGEGGEGAASCRSAGDPSPASCPSCPPTPVSTSLVPVPSFRRNTQGRRERRRDSRESTGRSSEGSEVCVVCMLDLKGEVCAKTSVCGHVFHEGCLKEWIEREHWSCPICRAALPTVSFSPHDL
ncbi:unnamed protein product [Vitrella brassicaformis CCMP3155]|uniref:RING-type domain-containing protein n=2 Tax=Vitrella brassicaformis TaxID=1169539 RepID=A0A0G4FY12_VITBC|nr:unnamed protein product [Vitrella brassicaformis CCMP3155]|mmetsp:Transcript_6354/g.18314  ORF Transcript_6354/g.18314 Transcript_6354/m.18314 type:complete len:283 (+) Transcript_6354:70-918(+)|eukprot:CEM19867.1 unnamed protein product [Vitrella brassicaformis CCMP3155]